LFLKVRLKQSLICYIELKEMKGKGRHRTERTGAMTERRARSAVRARHPIVMAAIRRNNR
jgi:hypothetical protein